MSWLCIADNACMYKSLRSGLAVLFLPQRQRILGSHHCGPPAASRSLILCLNGTDSSSSLTRIRVIT